MSTNITFKQFLSEQNKEFYHGQQTKDNPFNMKNFNKGNQQEGPGVYFGDYNTAKSYGSYVFKSTQSFKNLLFIPSRSRISTVKELYKKIPLLLKKLYEVDQESMFYEISNWIEVYEPQDIEDWHFTEMSKNLKDEEVRNFLITYADLYGLDFLEVFNEVYPKIYGTYNKKLNFYSLLKPVKLELIESPK